MTLEVAPGDIYAIPLPEGLFGAVRVVQTWDDLGSALVFTTTYLEPRVPELSDPRLLAICDHRFSVCVLRGHLPTDLIRVGHIPVTPAESRLSTSMSGEWGRSTGFEAYFNRLKAQGRPTSEIDYSYRAPMQRFVLAPNKPMPATDFWKLIDATVASPQQQEELTTRLMALSAGKIIGFECMLAKLLYQLDTQRHAEHLGTHAFGTDRFSADLFLYARCAVVARGKAFYHRVLEDPALMPAGEQQEGLLAVAGNAYQRKFKKAMEHDCEFDYETFANASQWQGRAGHQP